MPKKIILTFLTILFLSLSLSSLVKAAGEQIDPAVSPAIINLSLKPGENKRSSYTYFNDTDQDVTISIDVRAFRPSNGEHGAPIFQDKNGKRYVSEITNWIKLEKNSYEVAKKSNVTVNFEVDVPKDAKAGKYFAAVFNTESGSENKGGTLIKKEIGVTLVTEVLPLNQELGTKSFFNRLPWLSYVGIGLAIVAILLLVIMELKKKKKSLFVWGKRKRGKRG